MKDFQQHDCSEPNSWVFRFEHCSLAHAGLNLTLPLDVEATYIENLIEDLSVSGWCIEDADKAFLHFRDYDADGGSA